jgi:heme/copper-type cytochrome/quinol oxidase subunit 2
MPEAAADLLFWVALAGCAVAQIAIIRSVLFVTPTVQPDVRVPVSPRATEIAWALLPAAVLAVLFWVTWRAMHTHTPPPGMIHLS